MADCYVHTIDANTETLKCFKVDWDFLVFCAHVHHKDKYWTKLNSPVTVVLRKCVKLQRFQKYNHTSTAVHQVTDQLEDISCNY